MTTYQWLFFLMELITTGLFIWLFWKFALGICHSSDLFIKRFKKSVEEGGWEFAFSNSFQDILQYVGGYIVLFVAILIFPVVCILLGKFFGQVVAGNLSMSKFLNCVPEVAATVANYYANLWHWTGSFRERLFT